MSASLERAAQSGEAPFSWPGLLLSLVAAVVFPFDRVLAGMVGAGQGIEAICLYLGLSRAALDDSLVRLGLRTPHDRPLRKPGAHGWSTLHTTWLIRLRHAGVHPESIGQLLRGRSGPRSANAIRAKCRRLGLPIPDRKILRRVDPSTLVDLLSSFPPPWSSTLSASNSTAGETFTGSPRPQPVSPSAICGTAAGPVLVASDAATGVVVTLRTTQPLGDAPSPAPRLRSKGARKDGQRELQLFRNIPGGAPTLPQAPAPAPVAPSVPVPFPAGEPAAAAKETTRLGWIASSRDRPRNRKVVEFLSMRYFGGQSYKSIARETGLSPGTIASFFCRIEIPRDKDRSKFGDSYDEELAKANLAKSGYELAVCKETRRFFWRRMKDRAKVHFNRETRRAMGLIGEYERYKSAEICL